jgi:hypothetical protein
LKRINKKNSLSIPAKLKYKIPLSQNLFVYSVSMWKTGRYNKHRLRCYLSCSLLLCSCTPCGMLLRVAYRITTASIRRNSITELTSTGMHMRINLTLQICNLMNLNKEQHKRCAVLRPIRYTWSKTKRPTNVASLNLCPISLSLKLNENRQINLEEEVL